MARSLSAASSQSIIVSSAPSINLGTGDFTVMAWVRFPVEPPDDSMIVGKRAGGFDGDEGWELKINDGGNPSVRWDIETDVTGRQRAEATLVGLTDGNWHLVGGDHTDGAPTSQLQLWYDGAVAATKVANTPGTVDTVTPMVIGAAYDTPSNTNYITAEFGPVFVCPRLLSPAEHQWLAAGFSMRFLNPAPCFLMELTSRASPEPDIGRGGLTGTLENAPSVVDNPRIIYPRAPDVGQGTWYIPIEATIAGQSALAATIVRSRAASAAIAGQSSVAANLTADVAVAATIAGQSLITADISPDASIRATISGQSGIVANAAVDAHIRAAIAGQSAIAANANYEAAAVAGIDGQSDVQATATVDKSSSATIAGQSAIVAGSTRVRTAQAQIDGQSAITANATADHGMSASIDGQSALTTALAANCPVSSVVTGQSALTARLSADAAASAAIAGQSALTATVVRSRAGSATVAGQSAITANATSDVATSAAIAGQSGLTADAAVDAAISAIIAGQSSIAATLRKLGESTNPDVGGRVTWRTTTGGGFRR